MSKDVVTTCENSETAKLIAQCFMKVVVCFVAYLLPVIVQLAHINTNTAIILPDSKKGHYILGLSSDKLPYFLFLPLCHNLTHTLMVRRLNLPNNRLHHSPFQGWLKLLSMKEVWGRGYALSYHNCCVGFLKDSFKELTFKNVALLYIKEILCLTVEFVHFRARDKKKTAANYNWIKFCERI